MKVYGVKNIKNVALLGHAGSGKTTLTESLLYEAGSITRIGTVEDHNTVSDSHELEHERGCSVFSTQLITEYMDQKFNIFDTPGFDDYIGEMIAPLSVCDTGMIVINAANGLEVGSENGWVYSERLNKSVAFVINKLDGENVDFDSVISELQGQFSNKVTLIHYPVSVGSSFDTIIDILHNKAYKFNDKEVVEVEIPASERDKAESLRNELIESVAESDEDLMGIYFEEGDLTQDQLFGGLNAAIIRRQIFPVLCSSAKKNVGAKTILDFIANVLPSPDEMPVPTADGSVKVDVDPNKKTSLFVFKIYSDAKLGDTTYFKVKSGTLKAGADLINENRNASERFGALFTINGKKREEVEALEAGDIGAAVKLKTARINDTLHEKGFEVKFSEIPYPLPKVRTAIGPKTKGEEEKVGLALNNLHEQDPTILIEHSQELRQTIVYVQGELHLGVMKWRLENRYKVEVVFSEPRIPYRETIQKTAQGMYRHKKQSGGAGQFAEVHMFVEPYEEGKPYQSQFTVRGKDLHELSWGGKLEFVNCIVGGVIDARFFPAILKGIMEKMEFGPLTDSYARDIRVYITDGKMHAVDSNEAAFKTAAVYAFRECFKQAGPKVLEPIYKVEIKVPEEFVGDVMSDLPTRRGLILGIDSEGRYQKIIARMPLAEVDKYSTALRSMTQARATYVSTFEEYQAVPSNIQDELIKKNAEKSENE